MILLARDRLFPYAQSEPYRIISIFFPYQGFWMLLNGNPITAHHLKQTFCLRCLIMEAALLELSPIRDL